MGSPPQFFTKRLIHACTKTMIMLMVALATNASTANSQLNKLKDKLKGTTGTGAGEKPVAVKTSEKVAGTAENATASTGESTGSSGNFETIRNKYEAGKMVIMSNEDPKPALAEVPAFLTFTNNYRKPEADVKTFTGKDFVYATLKLPQNLTDYLPGPDAGNLEYYRVVIKAWPDYDNYKVAESNLKLSKKADFPLAYQGKRILISKRKQMP